jgi:hypothetical protein
MAKSPSHGGEMEGFYLIFWLRNYPHDRGTRPAPGVFSIMQQLAYAQRHGLRYHYLGYWIAGCPSMAYKGQYRPHELLVGSPSDDVEPTWIAG